MHKCGKKMPQSSVHLQKCLANMEQRFGYEVFITVTDPQICSTVSENIIKPCCQIALNYSALVAPPEKGDTNKFPYGRLDRYS